MTAEEFLATDQRTFGEGRFELIDGRVVAMAPTTLRHSAIQSNIDAAMRAALKAAGLPCRPLQAPGVRIASHRARVWLPDVVVFCREPPRFKVLFEILSPTNKGPAYEERIRDLTHVESADEIVELAQDEVFARVLRRSGDGWWDDEVRGEDAVLELQSLGIGVRMAEFYDDLSQVIEPG